MATDDCPVILYCGYQDNLQDPGPKPVKPPAPPYNAPWFPFLALYNPGAATALILNWNNTHKANWDAFPQARADWETMDAAYQVAQQKSYAT